MCWHEKMKTREPEIDLSIQIQVIMKRSFFLALVFFAHTLSAQQAWLGNVHFDNSVDEIFIKSNGQIVLVMKDESDALVVLDAAGNVVKKLDLNGLYEGNVAALMEMGDSTLVFFNGAECDIITCSYFVFDASWNELGEFHLNCTGLGRLFRLDDGTFLQYDDHSISRYTADFMTLLGSQAGGVAPRNLLILPGDTIVYFAGGSLHKMTSDFQVVDLVSTTESISRLALASDGTILAFGQGWVGKYDSELNLLDSQDYQAGDFVEAAVADGEFAVLTDVPSVIRFDNDLQKLGEFPVHKLSSMRIEAFSYYGNRLLIGGGKRWGSDDHGNWSGFLAFYSLDGQSEPIEGDVALNSVEHLGSIHSTSTNPNQYHWDVTFTDIRVVIANNSADTLHSVVLKTRMALINLPFSCPLERKYTWHFEGLQIPPGQSGEVFLDSMLLDIGINEAMDFSTCFWLSLPNDTWDTNNDNDVFCASLPVGVRQTPKLEVLSVFPNPAKDLLVVSWENWMPTEHATFELADVLGRPIQQWRATPGSNRQNLSLDAVPAGVYTLLLKSQGRLEGLAKVVVR